jgi:site-specific recombinase XerD
MAGIRERRLGALGPYVDGYRALLLELGYTPQTTLGLLTVLGQLCRWMSAQGLPLDGLNPDRIDEFLAYRRSDEFGRAPYRPSLVLLLEHLVAEGAIPAVEARPPTVLDSFIASYREWLSADRGLAATTVVRYENTARRFLRQQFGGEDRVEPATLTGAQVNGFLLAESVRCSVGAAKGRVAELRALLRYLYLRGMTATPLAAAVPPVAGWHQTRIPPTLSSADVASLLATCDRSTVVGARNFAVMKLVARLGLRSIEVARLELDDVDWRQGEVLIRGKVRRLDRMPLPADVGEALAAYLTRARPAAECRRVFLTCRAPRRGISAGLVRDVVKRACAQAGLPDVGPHRMRHALATELLASGVALSDISQVLRHRDLATTAIYAKVDFASLRGVAREWPGATR